MGLIWEGVGVVECVCGRVYNDLYISAFLALLFDSGRFSSILWAVERLLQMDLSRGVGFVVAGAAKGGLWRGRRVCSHEGRPVSFRYGTLDRVNNGLVLRMSVGTEAGGDQIRDVCAIVLAGGVGKRMRADRPKQFLTLCGKTILERSLQIFLDMEEVSQVRGRTIEGN